ncbi:MAG: hypothetical protein ABI823_04935 [Bryobacteraceae bacterium]
MIPAVLLTLLSFQSPFVAAPDHYKLEFENEWVQVVRVSYGPHGNSPMHDHPEQPTVMIYTTDGAPLKFKHKDGMVVNRPTVKANGIRFTRGAAESHIVEYQGDQPSEYLRVELKTDPLDRPERDVRIAPQDRTPYENGQLRILRVQCAAEAACPASMHPEDPAVVVTGRSANFIPAGAPAIQNPGKTALDQIRIELKSKPLSAPRSQ